MKYEFSFAFLEKYWPLLLQGTIETIKMSLIVTFLGFLLGALCAVASISKYRFLRIIVAIYVEAIRNTPLLIQLFLVYFGLSSLGLKFSAQASALIGLTINVGAYSSEIIRAGLQSINKGQLEAADTLGLNRLQMLAAVMLPPALERVYPSLVSQYVLLMLATSVASQISAEELTGAAARIQSMTFRSFEVYLVILVIYLLLSFLMRGLFKLLALGFFPRKRRLGTNL
ncbi:amino acid ABC transporter permease [Brucella pseudogrignonensis]|uniref:Polar amino acid transport system permease protein n=1 Tax=Brucella pseudogrignonensis TaxID=419475 RepID=A0ABU1MC21_9HYPH|nr:amino acid ABC transporter permease [Brucella pseudogrignonensis]MDR6433590.1 polar amino acid transport system permease protein [Brucella pseudogrignonensis]